MVGREVLAQKTTTTLDLRVEALEWGGAGRGGSDAGATGAGTRRQDLR